MSWFDRFRRPKSVLANPGETIEWHPRLRARVLDLFIEADSSNMTLSGVGEDVVLALADLPVRLERYEVRRVDDGLVVDLHPLSDDAFMHVNPGATSLACSPITAWDFRGLALEAPAVISYSESLSTESWHARKVPSVVVAGYYCFGPAELVALPDWPDRAIHLIVSSSLRGEAERHDLRFIWAHHRYEAVGINESPAPDPPWDPSPQLDPGFVSTGGYFNMPLGLYIDEPSAGPYKLMVHAECDPFRTEIREIEIVP